MFSIIEPIVKINDTDDGSNGSSNDNNIALGWVDDWIMNEWKDIVENTQTMTTSTVLWLLILPKQSKATWTPAAPSCQN